MGMMAKPVILSVDDDPEVLARGRARPPRATTAATTASSRAASGAQGARGRARAQAARHAGRAVPGRPADAGDDRHRVARRGGKLHPDARKVLLTAYADTEAAIRGINDVGLDHYLLKPWDPPEQRLYPVLDDLLADWTATVRLPYDGIRVVGARWSPQSYRRQGVPGAQPRAVPVGGRRRRRRRCASWCRATATPRAARRAVPGRHARWSQPTDRELADRIGLQHARQPARSTTW